MGLIPRPSMSPSSESSETPFSNGVFRVLQSQTVGLPCVPMFCVYQHFARGLPYTIHVYIYTYVRSCITLLYIDLSRSSLLSLDLMAPRLKSLPSSILLVAGLGETDETEAKTLPKFLDLKPLKPLEPSSGRNQELGGASRSSVTVRVSPWWFV